MVVKRQEYCYRVTDLDSITFYDGATGYTANDRTFEDEHGKPVTSKSFRTQFTRPSWNDEDVAISVSDHITGGWSSYASSYRQSEWISSTVRYDRAI
jgi:hypothetical protein